MGDQGLDGALVKGGEIAGTFAGVPLARVK
jgi:hypothetical protein